VAFGSHVLHAAAVVGGVRSNADDIVPGHVGGKGLPQASFSHSFSLRAEAGGMKFDITAWMQMQEEAELDLIRESYEPRRARLSDERWHSL